MKWPCGLALIFALMLLFLGSRRGSDFEPGVVATAQRSVSAVADETSHQQTSAAELGADPAGKQILFGDLHVHTTWSIDAFLYSLPIFSNEGAHPPADACDYARFCSALDFFSINDHAESLTPERWRETIETLRACDARADAGAATDDRAGPDLIPLLGWEWTQVGPTPETHYGHKNVVIRSLDPDAIPARPIAYRPASDMARAPARWQLRAAESAAWLLGTDYADFMWWMGRLIDTPLCPSDVDTRELPPDCLESADDPSVLFRKLDEWGLDSIVIPHGLAWGIHAPPGATLADPLAAGMHDPGREILLETFSGHGNSEEFREAFVRSAASDPDAACPAPTPDHLACCWQAGELMRARCGDLPADECEGRVVLTRRLALEAGVSPEKVIPETSPADWLDCDMCRDCFKPVAKLRPQGTAQYSLAVSRPGAEATSPPSRYRWGFIASSDNHSARAATGFKQFDRLATTDSRGLRDPETADWIDRVFAEEPGDPRLPRSVEHEPRSFSALFDGERNASFMYPGGLVAVHAAGRSREALWQALARREVYGTSGPRILLWFDLLNGPNGETPMGSQVRLVGTPRFRVRAAGAYRQKPGCPDALRDQLGASRLQALCLGECHNPGDTRHPIVAIEVVRVRPQTEAAEPIETRIEDPWRRFECPPDPAGCTVEFDDPEFAERHDDAVYYVRALQAPTPAINGGQLRARFDEQGNAVAVDPCYGNWQTAEDDDCLAPVSERAWSSPIYLDRDLDRDLDRSVGMVGAGKR